MTLGSTSDGRVAAAVGLACWVQLGLAPPLAHRADPAVATAAVAALVMLFLGTVDLTRRSALPLASATLGFFAALGLEAVFLTRHPVTRFDLATRVAGAFSAATYIALVARARTLAAPRLRGTVAVVAADPVPGPRWRGPALGALGVVVVFCAVVVPAWLALTAGPAGVASRGLERLLRGRHALVSGGGLCLGLLTALIAGSPLLRAEAPRPRRFTRALTYGVWAGVAWSMRTWLDRAR